MQLGTPGGKMSQGAVITIKFKQAEETPEGLMKAVFWGGSADNLTTVATVVFLISRDLPAYGIDPENFEILSVSINRFAIDEEGVVRNEEGEEVEDSVLQGAFDVAAYKAKGRLN